MLRTRTCGELRASCAGEKVELAGWVHHKRHHGGVLFIDLRDRYGRTQITFRPENNALFEKAEKLGHEDVILIEGTVTVRPPEACNSDIPTGAIEVIAEKLEMLSSADTLPFVIEKEVNVLEDTRLEYRYLDLRRPAMQEGIILRSEALQIVRQFLTERDFLEIETPTLIRSTPEGARDFLVPSRLQKAKFYALPQSPQIYKQLLMIAGFDRYFQLPHCYRDEDLRADRQLEFTQIDIEMSFIEEEDILKLSEELIARLLRELCGINLKTPLPRIPFDEAMLKYGTDKPDTRFGLEIKDITKIAKTSGFKVFSEAASAGAVRAICSPKSSSLSRKAIDDFTKKAQELGAKGLAFTKFENGDFSTGIGKFLTVEEKEQYKAILEPEEGSLILFVADKPEICASVLGALRLDLAKQLNLIEPNRWDALFVIDFPMFETEEGTNRLVARHHPFTQPSVKDIPLLKSNPMAVHARAYDLVLNGCEIAGGSIRTHDPQILKEVLETIEISPEKANEKFGYLIKALTYGAPPHGGIAFGFDRMIMLFAGKDSIRDVIAFPKTTSGQSPMDGCPNVVDPSQLEELGIKIIKK